MIFSLERGFPNDYLQTKSTPAVNPKFKSSVNVGKTYILSPSITGTHHQSAGDDRYSNTSASHARSVSISGRRPTASPLLGGGRRIAHQKMRSPIVRDSSSTSRYFWELQLSAFPIHLATSFPLTWRTRDRIPVIFAPLLAVRRWFSPWWS